MKFSAFLRENSLYGGDGNITKDQLLIDNEKTMDSLIFNFFGFLGLVKLNDGSGFLKTYQQNDKITNINSITDDSNDVALSMKLALDAGCIKQTVALKMTRMLQQIKQKKLDSQTLTDASIRSLLDEIKYTTFKPSQRVLQVLKDYHSGVISLAVFTKKLYVLSKLKDYIDKTKEFRILVVKGQYVKLFAELSDAELSVTSPNSISTANTTKPIEHPDNKAIDFVFFQSIVKAKKPEFDKLLLQFKITRDDLFGKHYTALKEYIERNLPTIKVPNDFKSYPIFSTEIHDHFELLSIAANYEIVEFYNNQDVNGFIKKIKELDNFSHDYMEEAALAYNKKSKNLIKVIADTFARLFYEQKVDNASLSNKSIMMITEEATTLFTALNYYVSQIPGANYGGLQYNEMFLNGKFDKRFVVAYASGMIAFAAFRQLRGINADDILATAFGANSGTNKANFVLKRTAYNKANEELQDLFQLLIQHDRGEIYEDPEEDEAILQWYDSLFVPSMLVFQDPNSKKIPDISGISSVDTQKVIKLLKNNLSNDQLILSIKYFVKMMEISLTKMTDTEWLKRSVEIFVSFFDGTITAPHAVFGFLTNDISAEITRKKIEENISAYADIAKLSYGDLTTFLGYPDAARNRSYNTLFSTLEWLIDLHNAEKIEFTTPALYSLAFRAGRGNSAKLLPFIDVRNTKLFAEILKESDYLNYSDYERNYYQWVVDNNPAIRKIFLINNYEMISSSELMNVLMPKLSIELLRPEYTTDDIIENFKDNIWPDVPSNFIMKELQKYKKNKKLFDALLEFIKELPPTDLNYNQFQILLMSLGSAAQVKEIVLNIKAKNRNVQEEIASGTGFSSTNLKLFFNELSNNQDVIENIETDIFVDIMQAATINSDTSGAFEFVRKVKNYDETKIDVLITKLYKKVKNALIEYLIGADIGMIASKEIFRDDVPIKPYEKLTETRIGEILKYNKITPNKDQLSKTTTVADMNKLVTDFSKRVVGIKAKEVKVDQEYLERKTIEYDTFNKYRHGNIAPKILREFDVNIPEQIKAFNEYVAANSWMNIMDPVFHGTGSVGASMILRYGFAVISAGDSTVTGRMLGDGVYFSNVIDKVAQYVADSGFSRGVGNKGFIFVMKAALGMKNKDYRSDGVDNINVFNLVSPEWCVYHPEKQLHIYKAFEVELVQKEEIIQMKQKYQIKESAVEIKTFKEYLRESSSIKYTNATTYTFMDGTIPQSKTSAVDFEQFDTTRYGTHVRIEGSQIGPMLTIEHNGPTSQAFCVRNTAAFMEQSELNNFLDLLSGKVDI